MKIGILGLGLIGGSIAKALKSSHFITAYDVSQETIQYALDNKIIHQSYDKLSDFLKENDVIYLCLYPKNIVNFIFQNKDLIPTNSILIEISGIKNSIINEINKISNLSFDLVYTHPIAGSEKIGVYNSNEQIFKNANYVITPVSTNKKENIETAKTLAKQMGFKTVSLITPEEHDDIIAYTSQLTHVLSLSLVNAISTSLHVGDFIGDSYKDLTRISIINDQLWPELFLSNKDFLLNKIHDFEVELDKIKHALIMNNFNELSDIMKMSTRIRKSIEED